MVIVSASTATTKSGKVKKGYRKLEVMNRGKKRVMFMTDTKKKPVKKKNKKEKVLVCEEKPLLDE
jgi:hypothetical protein